MDKRLRTNLLLAIAVIALALFTWMMPEPGEQAEAEVRMLDSHTPVTRIEVRENEAVQFRLQRHDDRWRLTEPVEVEADRFQVDSLLAAIRTPAVRRFPIADADLAELGLQEPRWSLRVNNETWHIGERTALGNNRYVSRNDTVYLVSDVMTYRLQRNPLDYASKRLLPADAEIVAFELPAGQRLQRDEQGWRLQPENPAVSADAIQDIVDAWNAARATSIRAVESLPEGESVHVELATGATLHFIVTVDDDALVLTQEQPALRYELPREQARRLLQLSVSSNVEHGDS